MWASFLHSTHTPNSWQGWQSKAKLGSSTLPQHSYCSNPPGLGGGGGFISSSAPPNPSQRAKVSVTWPGARHEGAWWVRGHNGQPRGRHTWCGSHNPSWSLSLPDKSHTHNQAHRTHQDGSMHHIQFVFYYIHIYTHEYVWCHEK